MPVTAITYQPATGQLLAAYRPIVFKVEAISTAGEPVPPYVVADIYIQDIYYKSIIRTSAEEISTLLSQWNFDISDALKEYLQPDIAVITNSDILPAIHMSAKVMVRFRSSDIDVDGFTVEEGTRPVQATKNTPAVAGSGLQSNFIFVVNSALQHEDNQNLELHLNSFKQGSWSANAFPLTHRNRYLFCPGDSDHFPMVFTGDCIDASLTINYRLRGQSSWSSDNATGSSATCVPIGFTRSVTGNQVSILMNSAAPAGGYFLVQYKKTSDSVWIDVGSPSPAPGIVFTINGSDVAGNYNLRVTTFCSPCASGSVSSTFTLSGVITNKDWRGINPYCVVQNPSSPVYIVLETRNLVTDEAYSPSDLYRTSRAQTAHVDLYAKFYSDATHLTPVSVTATDMRIYVKQINNQNMSSDTGFSDNVVQTIIPFTVSPAGNEVLLGQVIQQLINQNYSAPWDGTGFPTISATSTTNSTYQPYPDHQLTSGNTGFRAFANLQEYNSDTNTPILGSTKANDSGDPDYIAPTLDTTICPAGPPTTAVSYGYDLEVAKVEIMFNSTSVYAQTVVDTDAGGYNFQYNVPRNTNVSFIITNLTLG